MHTAELFFRRRARVKAASDHFELANRLLVALERNGQLIPDTTWADAQGRDGYRVFVLVPESTSLRPGRNSRRVRSALKELQEGGFKPPAVRILGRVPDSDAVCRCRRRESLILQTDSLSSELPLKCGSCCGVVPFYRFGHTSEHQTYENIIFWLYHYRAFDSIWVDSGAGERLAYRQLSQYDSELTKEGLDVCRAIEKRARRPVYYYVMRYHGRSMAGEKRRRCPGCGRAWLLKQPWHGSFDFRCTRCRVVSTIAVDLRV